MNDKEVIEVLTAYSKYKKFYQQAEQMLTNIKGITTALICDNWIRTNHDSMKKVQSLQLELLKLQDIMEEY